MPIMKSVFEGRIFFSKLARDTKSKNSGMEKIEEAKIKQTYLRSSN